MIAENQTPGKPNVAHDGINGYGTVVEIDCGQAQDLDSYENYAKELMKVVAARLIDAGALDIGHIKAHFEGDKLFVYASAVGDAPDITVKGEGEGSPSTVKLTINSVVYGLGKDVLKSVTDDALEQVATTFGFTLNKQ
jgi:hypothetical protein